MEKTATSKSVPLGRSGNYTRFTCVRLVHLFSVILKRTELLLKTFILVCHYFNLRFYSLVVVQSGYFSSMFSGSWKESNMMVIKLEIPDQNIDTEGTLKISCSSCQNSVSKTFIHILCFFCSLASGFWVTLPG